MAYTRYHTTWHDKEVAQDSDLAAAFFQGAEDQLVNLTTAATVDTSLDIAYGAALVDASTWDNQGKRLQIRANYSSAGGAAADSADEHAVMIQLRANATGSTALYQKTGIMVQAKTDDPSGNPPVRNLVGIDTRGTVGATNTSGRVWGLYAQGTVLAGGDGDVYSSELNTFNNGTDVATPGSALQKIGNLNVIRGTSPGTAAYYMVGSGSTWHHGLYCPTSALGTGAADSFLELIGKFTVRPTGYVVFGNAGPQIAYGTGTPEASVTAPVGSLFLRTNGGAGTTLYVKETGSGNTGWVGK